MKVTREQAARNRERIVETAARLFRERGFEGVGVADLMKAAGLTHGGFYGHFDSKQELVREACERALEGSAERWSRRIAAEPRDPLAALARGYLAPAHRDHPGEGCLVAALGADAARHGKGPRRAIGAWLARSLEILSGHVTGRTRAARRQRAIAALSGWIGAMVLARAVDDRTLSDEVLAAVLAETTRR